MPSADREDTHHVSVYAYGWERGLYWVAGAVALLERRSPFRCPDSDVAAGVFRTRVRLRSSREVQPRVLPIRLLEFSIKL